MFTRRALSVSMASFLLLPKMGVAQLAQRAEPDIVIQGDIPPLPDKLQKYEGLPAASLQSVSVVGSGKPDDADVKRGAKVLLDSPFGTDPISVAEYFLELPEDLQPFRREWPVKANPVIHHFFGVTGGVSGATDVTPWCSAFLNWTLLRALASSKEQIGAPPAGGRISGQPFSAENIKRYSTRSASSGSFRCLNLASPAKRGDILVLANNGTRKSQCSGRGHVAIYLSPASPISTSAGTATPEYVLAIGGNQMDPQSGGAITRSRQWIGQGSRFYSFVRAPGS